MTINATVIADSISPQDIRLTTFQLRYPKFIHGEAKTHRVMRVGDQAYEFLQEVGFMDYPEFSRNASSSRAIPVTKLIQDVIDDPVIPIHWGKNQPGMQADEELTDADREDAIANWLHARNDAVEHARYLHKIGAHKQIVNRIIEPWCHINVVCTATDYENFFALRRHVGAQPEMRALADAMYAAREQSTPMLLRPGDWHLPYVDELTDDIVDMQSFNEHDIKSKLIKLSVARCARVSYMTHEGKPPIMEDDLKLYDRLVGSQPLHASPAEHQATPDEWTTHAKHGAAVGWLQPGEHGNLRGWRQYRKTLTGENVPG